MKNTYSFSKSALFLILFSVFCVVLCYGPWSWPILPGETTFLFYIQVVMLVVQPLVTIVVLGREGKAK